MNTILLERREGGIALVTLNRPERLNAITPEWIEDMHSVLNALETEHSLRAVVLTGAGRGFCAGYDLKSADAVLENAGAGPVWEGMLGQERLSGIVKRLHKLPQPVIAAVNGPAAGGGFALVLAADLRIAAASANFHVANARIGLSAGECGISWLFPRLVGLARCYELIAHGPALRCRRSRTHRPRLESCGGRSPVGFGHGAGDGHRRQLGLRGAHDQAGGGQCPADRQPGRGHRTGEPDPGALRLDGGRGRGHARLP